MGKRYLTLPALAACTIVMAAGGEALGDTPAAPAEAVPGNVDWSFRVPEGEKVAFQGVVNLDSAGMGTGSMLYPAPNIGGLLAAVITHGVISESSRNSQKQSLQQEADKVLGPYETALNGYTPKNLLERAVGRTTIGGARTLLEGPARPENAWLIETTPAFAMTQDQTALVLETAIAMFAPGADAPTYRNTIKVVSATVQAEDPAAYWTAASGERLKDESGRMLAHAIDIAVSDAVRPASAVLPQRTFRYSEGKGEKMERARLVSETCERVVLKTLRGWLMSVPTRPSANAAAQCPAS